MDGNVPGWAAREGGAGHVAHSAPELLLFMPEVTTKQDVWALGICLAELFTCRRVSFEHGTTDVLAQVLPLCDQKIPPWMLAKS